jgi:hypothetical protein
LAAWALRLLERNIAHLWIFTNFLAPGMRGGYLTRRDVWWKVLKSDQWGSDSIPVTAWLWQSDRHTGLLPRLWNQATTALWDGGESQEKNVKFPEQ